MKSKFVLSALFVFLFFCPSYGQVLFGVEGGPSLITIWGDKNLNTVYDYGFGFSGAVYVENPVSAKVSMKGIVSFERKGSAGDVLITDEFGNQLAKGRAFQRFDFIPFTVMIKYKLRDRFFINAGPYAAYLAGARNFVMSGNQELWDFRQIGFRKMDYGITAGIGAEFPVSRFLAVSVEARNSMGLRNIGANSGNTYKTNAVSLQLGFIYTIKPNRAHASF